MAKLSTYLSTNFVDICRNNHFNVQDCDEH